MRPIVTGPAMAVTHAGLAGPRLAEHPDSHRFNATHLAVLAAMGWHAANGTDDPRCRASLSKIATVALVDRKTAVRAQTVLEEAGVIERLPSRPRRPVEWRLRLLGERPNYGQRVPSRYGQSAHKLGAESPQTVGRESLKSKESLGSPRVTSGAGAPTAAAPWMFDDEGIGYPDELISRALAATPEQMAWARTMAAYDDGLPVPASFDVWTPETAWPDLEQAAAADVAAMLVALHGMRAEKRKATA